MQRVYAYIWLKLYNMFFYERVFFTVQATHTLADDLILALYYPYPFQPLCISDIGTLICSKVNFRHRLYYTVADVSIIQHARHCRHRNIGHACAIDCNLVPVHCCIACSIWWMIGWFCAGQLGTHRFDWRTVCPVVHPSSNWYGAKV